MSRLLAEGLLKGDHADDDDGGEDDETHYDLGGRHVVVSEVGEFVMVVRQGGPALGFQRVPDPTPGKNKVHLDLHTADKDAEVARLIGLGARETGRHSFGEDFDWVVLADPEGNAFCVAGG